MKFGFNLIVFQDQNGTCQIKPEYFNRNLSKKSKINQNLKWDKNYSNVFFKFMRNISVIPTETKRNWKYGYQQHIWFLKA